MSDPSQIVEKFQFARQVTHSGLVYMGGEAMKDERQAQIDAEIDGMDALELGNFIITESAKYASREAGQRLALMTKRFIFLHDRDVDAMLADSGLVIVSRLDDADPYAISDPTGEDPERVEGPVAGILEDVHTELGWFSLITSIGEDSTDLVNVMPLHASGEPQVRITSSRG